MKHVLVAAFLLVPALARAQETPRESVLTGQESLAVREDPRSKVEGWLISPAGTLNVGGELVFLTADTGPAGKPFRFSDVGILKLSGRYSIGGKVEVAGAASLLPKQPSYTDESVLQSASLGVRVGIGRGLAIDAGFSGGALMGDPGLWGSAAAGAVYKVDVDPTVDFELGLGGAATALNPDLAERTFWFAEVVARAETQLKTPNNAFGLYVGADLHFPFARGPSPDDPDPATGGFLDPQTRLDFHVGTFYGWVPNWDIYCELAVIDRGDADSPSTTLPILDGGFDQNQIILGVSRRFGGPERRRGYW